MKTGEVLGHYRVVDKLGEGGMGEVYRARDQKLGRDVAVKVLPEALAQDDERLARFEREARILASLNHPGIATLHGLEHADGQTFLVMELVEGETLAKRLERGAMPASEAIETATRIAEALDAAHERGIIHRDLKPANVMLTDSGQTKLVDFGLGKAREPIGADSESSDAPTLGSSETREGTVLGTPAYMSPEQARGKTVDKRADIWAFGCVVFEALTGRSAFGRDTASDTLSAVLRDEPEWQLLPRTSANVEPLVRLCLEKNPRERLRDIGDALPVLRKPPEDDSTERSRSNLGWPLALGLGLSAIAAALWLRPVTEQSAPAPVTRFVVTLPPDQTLQVGATDPFSLAPDGSRLVYAASVDGVTQLFLRDFTEFDAVPIADTEGAAGPFFSPDGATVGFFRADGIHRAELASGLIARVCPLPNRMVEPQGAWSDDGKIVFSFDRGSGLWRVDAAGGEPETITQVDHDGGERNHRRPSILRTGEVLFSIDTVNGFRAALWDPSTRAYKMLDGIEVGSPGIRYVESGHVVYGRSGTLFAVGFDVERGEVRGSPFASVAEVRSSGNGFPFYSIAARNLAFLSGSDAGRLVRVDRDGRVNPLGSEPGLYRHPSLSPEGNRLAVLDSDTARPAVWVLDLDRGTRTRVTAQGPAYFPNWSPDGQRLVLTWDEDLLVKEPDAASPGDRLSTDGVSFAPDWSPDGETLAFMEIERNTGDFAIKIWNGGEITTLPGTGRTDAAPRFSPDGRWLAYLSAESGRGEVYVRAYPGPGEKWTVSTSGGMEPVWARDGTELFYRDGDRMMVVPFDTGPEFRPGSPRVLFEGRFASTPGGYPNYDVLPDGSGFIMIQPFENEIDEIHVVLNWTEELKRLAPLE